MKRLAFALLAVLALTGIATLKPQTNSTTQAMMQDGGDPLPPVCTPPQRCHR